LGAYDLLEPIVGGTSDGLLSNLGVLFVPAGVGVIQNIALIADRGIAIAVVLLDNHHAGGTRLDFRRA
jgi:putative effector of murein hydrolase LrgA (UPF0299 family)